MSPGSATLTSAHVSNSRLEGSNFTPTSTFRPSAPSPINFIGRVTCYSSSPRAFSLSFSVSFSLSFAFLSLVFGCFILGMARENESCSRTVVSNCLRGMLPCFSGQQAITDSLYTVDCTDRDHAESRLDLIIYRS